MAYATYEYYRDKYGGEMMLENFSKAIAKAGQYIDSFTFGRITEEDMETYPSLPVCACEMAEIICRMSGNDGMAREVKSENTDGFSVTYVTESMDGMLAEDTLKRKLYAVAETYLMSTGLLGFGC